MDAETAVNLLTTLTSDGSRGKVCPPGFTFATLPKLRKLHLMC